MIAFLVRNVVRLKAARTVHLVVRTARRAMVAVWTAHLGKTAPQ